MPKDALALMAWKLARPRARRERLLDEHRHDGCLRRLLPEARDRHPAGLGANLPEDAIYPINLADDTGKTLDGANRYVLHFESSAIPPVNAFWSVTLYDAEGYQVPNSLNRSPSAAGCRSNTTPTAPSTSISRMKAPGQGSELASGAERALQPNDASLCAKERCADP